MKTPEDIIKSILKTEKGSLQEQGGKYLFWVDKAANKIEIKKAVEAVYRVEVMKVNTVTMRGKMKRVRYQPGKTPDWKKAVVTLKKGQAIELAS
ncbi:MAG: 50S ribosomal protein L23 [Candidatus Omnitrophica bacterium]|nr:50S ribosomal protein L23 [Candidatus Omnitrophota bacterium]